MTRLSCTNAVSINYFLSVCAGCEVSQSCVITILNKLPNLTALNFEFITLPVNERKVSMHNVQMQCIHVCAVTQPAQHACVCIVSCARCLRREGVSSTLSQVSWPCMYQFWHVHAVNHIVHPKSYAPYIHHMTLGLASCPSHDVYDDIIITFHCAMEFV